MLPPVGQRSFRFESNPIRFGRADQAYSVALQHQNIASAWSQTFCVSEPKALAL